MKHAGPRRLLGQIARVRRRRLESGRDGGDDAAGTDRDRATADARSRADAQGAAVSARRRLDAQDSASEGQD